MNKDKTNLEKLSNSIKKFESNLKGQKATVDQYLELLSTFETEDAKLKEMEFFYYSKTKENANRLKKDLEKIGYKIYGIEKSTENEYSIIGVTPPIDLEKNKFKNWIKYMNEIGFINDCDFDGWGTLSKLD